MNSAIAAAARGLRGRATAASSSRAVRRGRPATSRRSDHAAPLPPFPARSFTSGGHDNEPDLTATEATAQALEDRDALYAGRTTFVPLPLWKGACVDVASPVALVSGRAPSELFAHFRQGPFHRSVDAMRGGRPLRQYNVLLDDGRVMWYLVYADTRDRSSFNRGARALLDQHRDWYTDPVRRLAGGVVVDEDQRGSWAPTSDRRPSTWRAPGEPRKAFEASADAELAAFERGAQAPNGTVAVLRYVVPPQRFSATVSAVRASAAAWGNDSRGATYVRCPYTTAYSSYAEAQANDACVVVARFSSRAGARKAVASARAAVEAAGVDMRKAPVELIGECVEVLDFL